MGTGPNPSVRWPFEEAGPGHLHGGTVVVAEARGQSCSQTEHLPHNVNKLEDFSGVSIVYPSESTATAYSTSQHQSMCPPALASTSGASDYDSVTSTVSGPSRCPWHRASQLQPTYSVASSSAVAPKDTAESQQDGCINDLGASSSGSCASSSYVHQAWQLKRPTLQHDPKLTRRQLRQLERVWSLSDVALHKFCDDGWIAIDGKVYDITEHIANHPGWDSGCRVTEVLSIIAHLGCDCTVEFHEIHRAYPIAYKQLAAYYIGDLQA